MTGLRERKKQQTRQLISDVATGLFLERGFDAVTIAEIAEVADVSVNTVYNYFPAKEDLFFDREDEVIDRYSRFVRERTPGQSATRAVLERLRAEVHDRSPVLGLADGYDRFLTVVRESTALMARLSLLHYRITESLAATLREESGAAPDDPRPDLVAQQLIGVHNVVVGGAGRGSLTGLPPDEIAAQMLVRLDEYEALLSDTVLNYATRPAR
ncbi:TetR/AcrR family transcriptional regulator [Streptomyces armeniacus]|uniref:TetR/AcrR family transcriptional regulator n=1 Tax=Streptomyces armeniacus TaxID=83291 RepID=A0A345XSV8_9ACTN|nr:TetR/AcrR family transcriptional regulator [Streptomyces armeniacus]AXK34724.1 TetR/AcrR family transcriptional regulator [Streptomyces armeniacus]